MKLNTFTKLAVLSLLAAPVSLFAGLPVAEGELFAKGTVRVEHDSNVFSNNTEKSDTVTTLSPELAFTRETGWIRMDLAGGVNVIRYADYSSENSENPYGQLFLGWNKSDTKSDGKFLASARKTTAANETVNTITESNDYNVDVAVGHFATEKLGYRIKANYSDQDFMTTGMSDVRKLMGGADARFQYSPKLEFFAGYAYRENTSYHRANNATDIDSYDNQLQVGVEGELASKLKGRIGAGLVDRNYRRGVAEDLAGLFVDASVTWKYSELGSVKIFLKDDLDVSPVDQAIRRVAGGFDVTHAFSPKLEFGGGLSYSHESYSRVVGTDRTDDAFSGQLRATYKFTPYISASLYLSYRDVDSTLAVSDYARTNIGVSVNAKF